MIQASWVISKIEGTISNGDQRRQQYRARFTELRSGSQPFREGRLAGDNTHIAKVLWAYQAPWDINLSGAYFYTSGSTYTRAVRFSDLNQGLPTSSRSLADHDASMDSRSSTSRLRSDSGWQPAASASRSKGFNLFNNGAVNDRFMRTGSSHLSNSRRASWHRDNSGSERPTASECNLGCTKPASLSRGGLFHRRFADSGPERLRLSN